MNRNTLCKSLNHKVKTMSSQTQDIYLSTQEAVALLGVNKATVKRRIDAGKIRAERVKGNGGEQYRILLSSLPESAQQAWLMEQAMKKAAELGDPRERAERFNADLLARAREQAARGEDPDKLEWEPVPVNQEEAEALWRRFSQAAEGSQKEAERRNTIMVAYQAMEDRGLPKGVIDAKLREEFGDSPATLLRWRRRIKGQPRTVWAPLLLPNQKGRMVFAEFTEEAWEFIKADWGRVQQPTIASCYRRAEEEGRKRNWVLPSLDAVERRIRKLPRWEQVLLREGVQALARLYPAQQRDYSNLKLHEVWCADGRKADVFCRWPDGEIGRPIVLGWLDVRSRVCVGYAIGKTESADLIRLALKKAAEASRALPQAALIDNGRGFASKLMTGGQPTRYRFKVKEEEIPGILKLLGIEVIWATPGHGQAKPIESWWRTLAQADKRAEFAGAYCGNRPEAKPEDFDPKNAVPIETYREIIEAEINAYHGRAHRGDAMDGRNPKAVYTELLGHTPVRQPTAEQLRLCLLAAEAIKPNRQDGSFRILGNRYWAEKCADLRPDLDYVVRFNPEDASDPVAIYDGVRFICEAPLIEKSGFRNQQEAKDHNRNRRKFVKSRKEQVEAAKAMSRAEAGWLAGDEDIIDTETGEILDGTALPAPKVVYPVRPANDYTHDIEEEDPITPEELAEYRRRAHEELMRKVAARDE